MFPAQLFLAGLNGLAGVIAGAYGSHGLTGKVTPERQHGFVTAAHYQIMHSAAMIGAIALQKAFASNRSAAGHFSRAYWGFAIGTMLFSGTIYLKTLAGPVLPGPLTPLGGFVLMGGWLSLMLSAMAL